MIQEKLNGGKLNVKQTVLLSFGFFGSSLVWSIYNAFVPQILEGFIASTFVIGMIMSIDNLFGVVLQPLFGKISDGTRSRFGRRLPFLFFGMPICAAVFVFIPYMQNLWSLMAVVIVFTFVMGIWRTPAVSLMPDLTPGPLQSKANGIVNLMGGIAAILAFAGGGLLFGLGGFPLPFLVSALMLLGALAVVALFVKEPELPYEEAVKADRTGLNLAPGEKTSFFLLLSSIFFWFAGYNAVETFFTLYATNTLGIAPGLASMMLSIFALTFVIFAVPMGMIGDRYGRKKCIFTGLCLLTLSFVPMIFIANIWLTAAMLLIGGVFWSCVNINSLPMITKMSGPMRIGTFIGYYYLFSFSANIVTTPIFGLIRDFVGHYQVLFSYAVVCFLLAIACLVFVKHGEVAQL